MKKYMKGLLLLTLPLMAALVSCSDDSDYDAAQKPTNAQVYFPTTELPTTMNLPLDGTTYTIQLMRQNTEGELTVELITTQSETSSTQVTVPQFVTFPDGQNTVDVVITYDPETTKFDDNNKVTISVADQNVTTPYGSSSYSFTAIKAAPYTSIGTGKYCDLFFYDPEEGSPFVPVEILQNDGDPYTFRIVSPTKAFLPIAEEIGFTADGTLSDYLEITIVPSGTSYRSLTSTDDCEYVYFYDDYATGFGYPGHGTLYYMCPVYFKNYDMSYNKVVCYQEPDEDGNILPGEIELAPLYLGPDYNGWAQNTNEGVIRILFPGYEPKDYASSLTYAGILTDPSEAVFACGDLTLGADATDVKAIVMTQDEDPEAVADALAAGELEGISVQAGRIEVPFDAEELGGNKFQIVVAVIDENGKVQSVSTANFEYYGGGDNPWVSIGTGMYSDGVLPVIFDFSEDFEVMPSSFFNVEILKNTANPGLYRIVNAYRYGVNPFISEESEGCADGDYIEVNATDPDAAYITLQNTHVDFGYGEIYFQSAASYFMDTDPEFVPKDNKDAFGKLVDGTIAFPIQSYVYNEETYYYQGVANMGSYKGMDVGSEDYPIEVVLPDAPASVKAKAAAKVRATQFAQRLNGSPAFHAHKNANKARLRAMSMKAQQVRK